MQGAPAIQLVSQQPPPLSLFPFHIDEASVILRLDKCVCIYMSAGWDGGKETRKKKRGGMYTTIYLFIYRIWQIYIEEHRKKKEEDPL